VEEPLEPEQADGDGEHRVPRIWIRLVAYIAQMNSGSRYHVSPGARILWIVTMKFSR